RHTRLQGDWSSDVCSSDLYTRPRRYLSGSGGLVSTAADYLRFCRMLANGGELEGVRILGPRTLQLMTLNHLPGGQDLAAMAQNRSEERRVGKGCRARWRRA